MSVGRANCRAEDQVVEALVAEGFLDRIERVGHLKLGFDIRAHRIADEATGELFVKRIEVKGRLRGYQRGAYHQRVARLSKTGGNLLAIRGLGPAISEIVYPKSRSS